MTQVILKSPADINSLQATLEMLKAAGVTTRPEVTYNFEFSFSVEEDIAYAMWKVYPRSPFWLLDFDDKEAYYEDQNGDRWILKYDWQDIVPPTRSVPAGYYYTSTGPTETYREEETTSDMIGDYEQEVYDYVQRHHKQAIKAQE